MVSPPECTSASSRVLPAASIRRTTAGVTGSLNRNRTLSGGCATMLPSRGSLPTSDACASAPPLPQRTSSSAATAAARRIIGQPLWLRDQLEAGCRRLDVVGRLAVLRNLDPAADPLLAFLHHRKIQG